MILLSAHSFKQQRFHPATEGPAVRARHCCRFRFAPPCSLRSNRMLNGIEALLSLAVRVTMRVVV